MIEDRFQYEACRWSAGQPEQAKRWFDDLELTAREEKRPAVVNLVANGDMEDLAADRPAGWTIVATTNAKTMTTVAARLRTARMEASKNPSPRGTTLTSHRRSRARRLHRSRRE